MAIKDGRIAAVDGLADATAAEEIDAAGKLVYEQSVEVQYAVGSGTNARTYLIDRGGIMFESPITWYAEKRIWDLSPGYHENPSQRFNRRIPDGCIQCHAGHAAPTGDGTSNRFEEQPFLELGIGCERCHGPGKRHVEKLEADDWDADDETAEERRQADGDEHAAQGDQRARQRPGLGSIGRRCAHCPNPCWPFRYRM